jgi:hypothetical protein
MVDDYLIKGQFLVAFQRHDGLLTDIDNLVREVGSLVGDTDLQVRRLHIQRQMAEMLRYQGRYKEAYELMKSVARRYKSGAHEPKLYASLGKADSLRLLGHPRRALRLYRRVISWAESRRNDGLLGASLLRAYAASQVSAEPPDADYLSQASVLAKRVRSTHRFLYLQYLLVSSGAASSISNAHQLLDEAEDFGPLSPSHLVAEFAHLSLCRAEVHRRAHQRNDASRTFARALDVYTSVQCRWGIVRSWIGCQLTGRAVKFPKQFVGTAEGFDADLLRRFETNGDADFAPGRLVACLP